MVAIHTGMHRGELLALKWNEVDLHAGAITVREAKSGETERHLDNFALRQSVNKTISRHAFVKSRMM